MESIRKDAASRQARDELFAGAYGELRKLAHARLRGGDRSHGMQTTALVHESYLRLMHCGQFSPEDRRAFFAYASRVMRSVVIDAVRNRQAERRGGDLEELTLDTALADKLPSGEHQILEVHEALLALEQSDPRLAKGVEMRYFGGYSEQEIAAALDITERTVRRDWERAQLILMSLLTQ